MKKTFLILFLISFSIMSYSQCNDGCITGNLSITLGQTLQFTSSPSAQCTECYDWDINGNTSSSDNQTVGTVKIVGSDIGKNVQIQGVSLGAFTLQLTYLDEAGCHTCCFSGNVVSGSTVTPLPKDNCFGFDPVQGTPDITNEGLLNYGYIGYPYGTPISSIGLTFTWYFKFKDGTLLTFYTQNPTFRELCPTNPVKSFALIVSNGVQSKQYRSIVSGYPIPGISGGNTPTCFIHADCEMGGGIFKTNETQNKILISPNPSSSILKFDGEELSKYKISIFNSNGTEIIKNHKIDNNINIEKYINGIYIYSITDEEGYIQKGKIIKE
jgi:hypothetical protein